MTVLAMVSTWFPVEISRLLPKTLETQNSQLLCNGLAVSIINAILAEDLPSTLAQRNDSHHPTNATAAISIAVLEERIADGLNFGWSLEYLSWSEFLMLRL
ncbi:hypothetical protein D8674_020671 [Pyrus ussuriensis x Pyrus communis]|uniref:Uncharacterized protein n=1 Tax=Pyrus ussuriensis x Pyrus communis TaxID=2448454 RepID=A0A5N5HK91_9ROSA|nr:hypothetical protein D8674_020671 [Pyrus ussuriensis x Pyrus communis]